MPIMTLNELSHSNSYFMTLTDLGVLQVEGEDAQGFLQNLLTNDVTSLVNNQSHLTGLCTPKGRLLAVFLLARRSNYYQLVLPKSMCTGLKQRLSMYILRAKVTITDLSEEVTCLGLLPSLNEQISFLDAEEVISYPTEQSRYLHISSKAQVTELVSTLTAKQWQTAPEASWELLDIDAGLPMVYPDTKEKFTTQQVNLDLVNGVSFKKGCYPGQEIVARLHYLGSPSRRMFKAVTSTATPANIGDEVTTIEGEIAGHIVRIQPSDDMALSLLVSLKLTSLASSLFINSTTEITILNKEISALD